MAAETAEPAGVDVGERLRAIRHLAARDAQDRRRAGRRQRELPQPGRARARRARASPRCTRIAAALGVNVADLFEPHAARADPRVLRRERAPDARVRQPRPEAPAHAAAARESRGLRRSSSIPAARRATSRTRTATPRSSSSSSRGRIHLQLGERLFELEQGDSIDYLSSTPHRVSNAGDETAEVMWIISPPSY